MTYADVVFQILSVPGRLQKEKYLQMQCGVFILTFQYQQSVQNAVQAFLSVKSAGPNVEKVEKLLANLKKTHPSVDRTSEE